MQAKDATLPRRPSQAGAGASAARLPRGALDSPLHRPELFDRLQRGDHAIFRAMLREQQLFMAGDLIIRGGEQNGFVYRIRTGWALRVRGFADGRQQIVAILLPGELCGVTSIVTSRHDDAIECATPVTTNRASDADIRSLAEGEPDAALRLLFQLAESDRRLQTWLAALGRADAEERMAMFLIELRARLRRIGLAHRSFSLPLTQQQIGDHLGLTVVHVNRVLRRFRECGVLTLRNRTVVLHDPARLYGIAAPILDTFRTPDPGAHAAA
jgi:CRP-like cAMP-binding protein